MIMKNFEFLDKDYTGKRQVYGFSGKGFSIYGFLFENIFIIERRSERGAEYTAVQIGQSEEEKKEKKNSTFMGEVITVVREYGSTDSDIEISSEFTGRSISGLNTKLEEAKRHRSEDTM